MSYSNIHSTAIIDPSAKIQKNVEIGAYSIIGPDVEIDEGTWIGHHVVISKCTKVGKNNKIYHFACLGEDPQDLGYTGEKTFLEIGDNNVFRECVTINRATTKKDRLTKIGNNNFFMSYSHVAHDCIIGNYIILANGATLGGHTIVEDYASIGAFCAIHQFCRVGAYSFLSAAAMINKDILPYLMVVGNDAKTCGLNKIGLERRGFSKETISMLREAYKIIFRKGLVVEDVKTELRMMLPQCPEVQLFLDGLESSIRGILR